MRYAYATGTYVYKLKGYSKKITQLVENGDFESKSGWQSAYGSFSVANNICTVKKVTDHSSFRMERAYTFTAGHKYYVSFEIYSTQKSNVEVYLGSDFTTLKENTQNSWYKYSDIKTSRALNTELGFYLDTKRVIAIGESVQIRNCMLHDLTADFGAGNEPTTIAQCEAYYGNKYIPYGNKILNCKMPIVAHGKNLFDLKTTIYPYTTQGLTAELQSDGGIHIHGQKTSSSWTNITISSKQTTWLRAGKTYISNFTMSLRNADGSWFGNYKSITPLDDKYIESGYWTTNSTQPIDTVIYPQLEEGSTATSYEPYYSKTIDCGRDLLFNDTLTTDGKVDIGSGKVDLGTLNWSYLATSRFQSNLFSAKGATYYATANIVTPLYYTQPRTAFDSSVDKTISLFNQTLGIVDTSYTNKDTFKTAMNGVMLDYELKTHTTSTFTPISLKDNLTFIDDNGYEVEVVESKFEVKKWKVVRMVEDELIKYGAKLK